MQQRGLPQAIECLQSGRLAETEFICRELLLQQPRNFQAHYYLGAALHKMARLDEAAGSYRQALEIQPDLPEAHSNLGIVLQKLGRKDEGLASLMRAVELRPDIPEMQNNLGNALHDAGRLEQAEACFRRAVRDDPAFVEGHNNLGTVLQRMGRAGEAIESFRAAARLRPDSPEIFNNLGNALQRVGRLDEAIACYQQTLTLRPTYAAAYANLANVLKDAGRLDEALDCYDRSLKLDPQSAWAHSGKLYAMHFHPASDARSLLEAHQQWDRRHAHALLDQIQPHDNDRSPARKLRIGYVSPNFRDHVIGRFILPLLAHHDRGRYEVVCYADVSRPDAMTGQIRGHCTQWCDTLGLSDEQLARQIRRDRIDILVDLTMHMGGSRLLAFARKPAPVQATYLAYCSTTGLSTMDYRLTDPFLDPPGSTDASCYSERSVWLPRTYWCYSAPAAASGVTDLPTLAAGHITFGCLNNFCKISQQAVETWCRILQGVGGSRLLIHAGEGAHRRLFLEKMRAGGIDPGRIEFAGFSSTGKYFERYQRIDLALDPFPYTGGTTTCDALWMGVPVVSLAGSTAVGRGGSSILSNVGLGELVVSSHDQYVRTALAWAADMARLADLRRSLRQRLQRSPLMDAPQFARDMESAYQFMWSHRSNDA